MGGRVMQWVGALLVLAVLASHIPGAASSSVEWTKVGEKVWLSPGEGIDLRTGGPGDDLIFDGDLIRARHGLQSAGGSRFIDYDLAPPATGYADAIDTSANAYDRIVVRLADGGYAQVTLGMASFSFMVYTGLLLEEWAVIEGAGSDAAAGLTSKGQAKMTVDSPWAEANGVAVQLDVVPQLLDGHLMIPLRFVGEALGLDMVWDGAEQKVTVSDGAVHLTLWVDNAVGMFNGTGRQLAYPPTLVQNRLLVPYSGVGEALGAPASFDAATGAVSMGGPAAPAVTARAAEGDGQSHFQATWLNTYKNGWISAAQDASPDFYLTLHADGTARVIQTITGTIGAQTYAVNLEYKGTYSLNPLRAELKLQPALKGWETLEHKMPYWQEMTVTGTLAADQSRIDNLQINDRAAKSGAATPARRAPAPGQAR